MNLIAKNILESQSENYTQYSPNPRQVLSQTYKGVPDIKVEGLTKSYYGKTRALSSISFEVKPGEAVALLGAGGSGKSTLLQCIARIIEPDKGSISLFGTDALECKGRKLRKLRAKMGFVSTKHPLVSELSVLSNVLHGIQARQAGPHCWYQSLAFRGARIEAMENLQVVGLGNMALKRAGELSAAQAQRASLARALMQSPEVIIADEPVSSSDSVSGDEIMNLFSTLTRQRKITFIFSSQHLEHALAFADRVLAIRAGTLELNAPV